MRTQARQDAQDVVEEMIDIELLNRRLRPLLAKNPRALEVSAEIETKARSALRLACILWHSGDSLQDVDSPAA